MWAVEPVIPDTDISVFAVLARLVVELAKILPAGVALPIVPYKTPVDPAVETLSCPMTKYLAVDVDDVIVADVVTYVGSDVILAVCGAYVPPVSQLIDGPVGPVGPIGPEGPTLPTSVVWTWDCVALRK
jgi:hypothetical protein